MDAQELIRRYKAGERDFSGANMPGFQFYKIEVGAGPNPKEWDTIGQLHRSPVTSGVLEAFHSGAYPPGTYTLRLVVVEQTGNYPEP